MKTFLIKLHQWALSHPQYVKPFHTMWQSFLGVFLVGISPILNDITQHHYADAKIALFALVGAAVAAVLSALKGYAWPILVSKSSATNNQINPGQ